MTPEQARRLDVFFANLSPRDLRRVVIVAGSRARAVIREHLLEQIAQGYPPEEREAWRQHGRQLPLEINGVPLIDGSQLPTIEADELLLYVRPQLEIRVSDPSPFGEF